MLNSNVSTKICSNKKDCPLNGLPQPMINFHTNKQSSDGLQYRCKTCVSMADKRRAEKNPEAASIRSKIYYETNKEQEKQRSREKYAADPEKYLDYGKTWREKHPERAWGRTLRYYYWPHLTALEAVIEYRRMETEQNNVCVYCGKPETCVTNQGKEEVRRLSVDHDHACCSGERSCGECVRWLLCQNCNKGSFLDNTDVMKKAVEKIDLFRATNSHLYNKSTQPKPKEDDEKSKPPKVSLVVYLQRYVEHLCCSPRE